MANEPVGVPNFSDALTELSSLPKNDQINALTTKPGCDYAGTDDNGNSTTCNSAATHLIYATAKKDFSSKLPRTILKTEEIKAYCPLHTEMAYDDLEGKLREKHHSLRTDEHGNSEYVHEAEAMPIHAIEGELSQKRLYDSLRTQLYHALTLNKLRHSGKIKNVPLRGFTRHFDDKTSDKSVEAEEAVREQFGRTAFEEEHGASTGDVTEAEIQRSIAPPVQLAPEEEDPMAVARQEIIEQPQDAKQREKERSRVRTRLAKAKAKGHNWCARCEKSAQNNPFCPTCFEETVDSNAIPKGKAGRPFKNIREFDNTIEARTYDAHKAMESIFGNSRVVTNEKGEKVRLPSTVDNVVDFVTGKGYAPERDFTIRGANPKSAIARQHYAPMEDYEEPTTLVPRLTEKELSDEELRLKSEKTSEMRANLTEAQQKEADESRLNPAGTSFWDSKKQIGAIFSGPKQNTGPVLNSKSSNMPFSVNEEGEYLPQYFTHEGEIVDFDPTGTSLGDTLDPNKGVMSRERQQALNVKVGYDVLPSTTCHECSLLGDTGKIRRNVKDHKNVSYVECEKGHRMPTSAIPVAWHNGRAVHVYMRPTTSSDSQGKRVYHWIATNEPAFYKVHDSKKAEGATQQVSLEKMQKYSSYRAYQMAMERIAPGQGVHIIRNANQRRRLNNNPELERKMAEFTGHPEFQELQKDLKDNAEKKAGLTAQLMLGTQEAKKDVTRMSNSDWDYEF